MLQSTQPHFSPTLPPPLPLPHLPLPPLPLCGVTSRDALIRWFVRLQLSDYEVMFHDSLEVAWLDKVRPHPPLPEATPSPTANYLPSQVDRRYAWLKRTLVTYEEECSSIFPSEWGIPEQVAMEFCNNTRSSCIIHELNEMMS